MVSRPATGSCSAVDRQGATSRLGWYAAGQGVESQRTEKEGVMLWTVAVILLVLWALGMGSSYTAGGLVHLLLVIAAVVVVFQFLGGRRSV